MIAKDVHLAVAGRLSKPVLTLDASVVNTKQGYIVKITDEFVYLDTPDGRITVCTAERESRVRLMGMSAIHTMLKFKEQEKGEFFVIGRNDMEFPRPVRSNL